mgnify:CR=1 FL=1
MQWFNINKRLYLNSQRTSHFHGVQRFNINKRLYLNGEGQATLKLMGFKFNINKRLYLNEELSLNDVVTSVV